MSSVLKRVSAAINVLKGGTYAVAVKPTRLGRGEKPKPVSFEKQVDAYFKDVALRDFVDVLSMQAVGMGFYTSCASEEDYEHAEAAKRIVDEFNQKNNIDALLQVTGREIVGAGNGIWQLFEPDKVKKIMRVPIVTFDEVITNEYLGFEETDYTKSKKLKLGYKQAATYGGKLIPPENLQHFRWNPIDASGWGCGVIRVVMEKYSWQEYNEYTKKYETRTRPSFLEIKAKLDLDLIEIFEKFAGPIEAWIAENKNLAEAIEAELQAAPKYGGRIVTGGGKVDIKSPPMEPRARFEAFVDYLWNQFCLGGQTPLPKLLTTPGFTEASATAAIDIADRLIYPIQRFIKRDLEMLWRKVIKSADSSLDPVKAAVRLNWGPPAEPDIEQLVALAPQLVKLVELKVVRPLEMRAILRDLFNLEMIAKGEPEPVE